jgi:hypothetical protein
VLPGWLATQKEVNCGPVAYSFAKSLQAEEAGVQLGVRGLGSLFPTHFSVFKLLSQDTIDRVAYK